MFFLTGRRLKRLLPYRAISAWTMALAGVEEWLLGECYSVVGDGAETATLILDQIPNDSGVVLPGGTTPESLGLAEWVEGRILPLRQASPEAQQRQVIGWIRELGRWERFTLFKLLTGELRLGVSQTLVVRALAQAAALPATSVAARLMGEWTPSAAWYAELVSPGVTDADRSRPYPFCLASPIDNAITDAPAIAALLGERADWLVEWKWDGIRAQLIVRGGRVYLWSRGEELITDRFPEVAGVAAGLADGTVLDGEILAWRGDRPLPFAALQQRIGRERQVARTARDLPVVFMAYDVLEDAGVDVRATPLIDRRARLEAIVERAAGRAAGSTCRRQGAAAAVRGRRHRHRRARAGDDPRVARRHRRDLGGAGRRARRVAAPRRRGPDAEAPRRPPMASAASAATGGSGRSIRTPSTRC